ncbi:MAG: dTMP kinase [Mycoplasmataceae bacterium]|jgi:dTMP kinase|nr:dTMP kinase [Mycoplasmataceae bacterium]
MSGFFITFEGPDGSGKSTILKMVGETLQQKFSNHSILLTREPGGTNNPIAEDIRNILLNKIEYKIDYHTEALLFAASRAQHVSDFIKPNLEKNAIVLCDRYIDSSIVYQGYGRKLGVENILKINEFAMQGVLPNVTFILMVKPEVGLERIFSNKTREVNRIDKEKGGLHQMVYDAYRKIIDSDKTGRIIEIDASKDLPTVLEEVLAKLLPKLQQNF